MSVLCVENMFIDVSTVFFGDINSRETAISPEKITMSMNIDSPQDLHPKSKLIWKIEYINDNNEHIVEEFSFSIRISVCLLEGGNVYAKE